MEIKPKDRILFLITYDPVDGIESGWHGRDRLFVYNRFYYGDIPIDDERQKFVIYSGKYDKAESFQMAYDLRKKAPSAPITIVTCSCDWEEKLLLLRDTNISIEKCECGSRDTLSQLFKQAMDA